MIRTTTSAASRPNYLGTTTVNSGMLNAVALGGPDTTARIGPPKPPSIIAVLID